MCECFLDKIMINIALCGLAFIIDFLVESFEFHIDVFVFTPPLKMVWQFRLLSYISVQV